LTPLEASSTLVFMMRGAAGPWMGAALFLLGSVGTPLHLAFEAHDWHHHHEDAADHEHDSDQETHPGVDHEPAALAKAPRVVAPAADVLIVRLAVLPPDVRAWVPAIEPEAQGPPDVFASPPRSPRSPPV
jgi:hypothetical protein